MTLSENDEEEIVGRPMTRARLIDEFSERLGISYQTSRALFQLLAELAIGGVKDNGIFIFPGIGRLINVERPVRLGRNSPPTAEIRIKTKTAIKFRAAKVMLEAVNANGSAAEELI